MNIKSKADKTSLKRKISELIKIKGLNGTSGFEKKITEFKDPGKLFGEIGFINPKV